MRKGQTGNLGLLDSFFYLVSRAENVRLYPYIDATKTCMFSGKNSPKAFPELVCKGKLWLSRLCEALIRVPGKSYLCSRLKTR